MGAKESMQWFRKPGRRPSPDPAGQGLHQAGQGTLQGRVSRSTSEHQCVTGVGWEEESIKFFPEMMVNKIRGYMLKSSSGGRSVWRLSYPSRKSCL